MTKDRPGQSNHLGPVLHSGGTTTELCNENMTPSQRTRGKEEFRKFVEDTVRGVMALENSRRCDNSSSLQVFCRIDVGVLQPKTGGPFYYYVNELERSLTVGLFRQTCTSMVWAILNSAVQLIPQYIDSSRRIVRLS